MVAHRQCTLRVLIDGLRYIAKAINSYDHVALFSHLQFTVVCTGIAGTLRGVLLGNRKLLQTNGVATLPQFALCANGGIYRWRDTRGHDKQC